MTNTGQIKFNGVSEALARGAKVVVGLSTYSGSADAARFSKKYADDLMMLHYAQVRIFEKGVKYRTRLAPI